jgi:putative transposase
MHLSAQTIADVYKERWQIELFFKWVKQNLKIKPFLSDSSLKNEKMKKILHQK